MKLQVLATFALVAFASCRQEQASAARTGGPLESYLVATKPAGAKPVLAVRAEAKPGDEVVVEGRAKDFVDGRALMTIVDPSKSACDEAGPMDECPTPWDYCCDPPEEITAATAMVELRDASGIVKDGLKGFHGLDHMDTVVASGTLETDAAGNVTVVAKQIYVAKRPPVVKR
jgi:hypothetical protein